MSEVCRKALSRVNDALNEKDVERGKELVNVMFCHEILSISGVEHVQMRQYLLSVLEKYPTLRDMCLPSRGE